MTQFVPVFGMGVFGVASLLLLKRFNLRWAIYLLPVGLFLLSSYTSATPDWRITISNVASMAVLFFVPLATVLYMPKLIRNTWAASLVALAIGGVTALTFQYAGLSLAALLGVQ